MSEIIDIGTVIVAKIGGEVLRGRITRVDPEDKELTYRFMSFQREYYWISTKQIIEVINEAIWDE